MSVGQYLAYAFGLGLLIATLVCFILAWRTDISVVGGQGQVAMWSSAAVAAFFLGGLAMRFVTKGEELTWPDWPFLQVGKWGGEDDYDDDYDL